MARGKTEDAHEVLAVSWNVQGNSVVRNELLNAHLPFSNKTDIVVLSLQEVPFGSSLTPHIVETLDLSSRCSGLLSDFREVLDAASFVLLHHVEFGYLCSSIYVHRRILVQHSVKISQRSLGLGLFEVFSNKGAIAVRLQIDQTNYTFINCHLQAHNGHSYSRRRQEQIKQIASEMLSNVENEHVLWMGDFNFRVQLPRDRALQLIHERLFDELQKHDDRPLSMSEPAIRFQPTYKFTKAGEYHSARVPSYTDRIFYLGRGGASMAYDSLPCTNSDHRPVYSLYDCPIASHSPRSTWVPGSPFGRLVDTLFVRLPTQYKAYAAVLITFVVAYLVKKQAP